MARMLDVDPSALRLSAPYSQVAVLTTDLAGQIVSCTGTLAELGLGDGTSAVGRSWNGLFGSSSETQVDAASGLQWSFFPDNGDPSHGYRVSRYPLLDRQSRSSGYVCIVERVAPTSANDRMLHYERMFSLGETVASVAHEVNNPLSVISGWLQILQQDLAVESSYREPFAVMQEEVDRIARVVANLLTFARRTPPETSSFSINELVSELVAFVEYQFNGESISITTALDPNVPAVEADRNKLKQVLWNLMNNARQAMPKGGQLLLSTHAAEAIQLRISDTGCGIPPHVLQRVFEPFFTTKQGKGGTGLGLSVSRSIIGSLGGELTVQSQPGAGTTFTISLPITGAHNNADA